MKAMKKIFVGILMLCMVLSLCACGGSKEDTNKDNNESVGSENSDNVGTEDNKDDAQEENEDDGKVVYKVTVVDEAGNPIAGAMVQVCDEGNCYAPAKTNAEGVVEFQLAESDEYKAKLMTNPEGYEAADTDYVHFEDGSNELTLTVKAVE